MLGFYVKITPGFLTQKSRRNFDKYMKRTIPLLRLDFFNT